MDYLIVAGRVVSAMALVLFLVLKTGRRKISELPVYDFLSIIILGSVIGADIADLNVDHMPTLFAVALLVLLQYLVSRLLINNKKIAKKITFGPTVVIQNGQFIKSNMERLKYPVENVLMALREKDVFDLGEVDFAVVESSGNISVLKKPEYRPLTPTDMRIQTDGKSMAVPLIVDGHVYGENLKQMGKDIGWLEQQLGMMGIESYKDVFYADMDTGERLYVSKTLQTQDFSNDFRL